MNVGDGGHDLGRQRHRAVGCHAVDVVHPEPYALEVKCRNGSGEAFAFVHHPCQVFVGRDRSESGNEIVDAAFCRQSMFCRHSSDHSNGVLLRMSGRLAVLQIADSKGRDRNRMERQCRWPEPTKKHAVLIH
jgi:hypothetical protein